MGNLNPVLLYYDIVCALSLVLSGIYIFKWHKHFDSHITLVYMLVPVMNVCYALLARSTVLEEAVALNKMTYIGGCYLVLLLLMVVSTLCGIRLNRFVKMALFAISTSVFIAAMFGDRTGFYSDARLVFRDGVAVLEKDYGWMHSVFYGMVIVYFLLALGVIVYTFIRKNQISRKILLLLFLPEVLSMAAFFGGRSVNRDIALIPAAYVVAQFTYLVVVSRISLYDITDTAIDSVIQRGDTGFISIDYGGHYLGSNETAKAVLPVLNELTVDLSVRRRKSFSDLVTGWLEDYAGDERKDTEYYEKDGRIYLVRIGPLYNGRKEKGYQLTLTDDTKEQELVRNIRDYNERLEKDVEEKTANIVEMHNKLILGMATMVESRDNSTGGHIRRTSEGVRILLAEMDGEELTPSFRKKLIKAAPMHDLGKIAVRDEVLRKPGRFTPEEYEQMKAHAPEGARIVHEILRGTDDDEFHIIAENVAKYHHERWDGSGYPEGLRGEEIPTEARIMAVADVYDALVSRRVYKDRMSFGDADRIMREGMGTQFDPGMEEVYLRARPKLEAYYRSNGDDGMAAAG